MDFFGTSTDLSDINIPPGITIFKVHSPRLENLENIIVRGPLVIHLPSFRYDLEDMGVISISRTRVRFSQILQAIKDYYTKPLTREELYEIEELDPMMGDYIREVSEEVRGPITRGDLMGGLIWIEGFRGEDGDYDLLLGS